MSNVVGYARVSKREQNPETQEAELRAAGASRVFVDHSELSRGKDRPQWLACLDCLRPGNTLMVRRLDPSQAAKRLLPPRRVFVGRGVLRSTRWPLPRRTLRGGIHTESPSL